MSLVQILTSENSQLKTKVERLTAALVKLDPDATALGLTVEAVAVETETMEAVNDDDVQPIQEQ